MTRKTLRSLFFALLLTLIFEGITRKLMPVTISKYLILLKDCIIFVMALGTFLVPMKGTMKSLRITVYLFALCLLPLIIYTATKDPLLAVFGAKQYLLYPWVLFAFVLGFQDYSVKDFFKPLRMMTMLLPALTLLAVIQIFLPDNHWLNLSVTGDDLSAFKAGGRLRVSSTFPFVAQFCYYLTILLPVMWVMLTLRKRPEKPNLLQRFESIWVLVPFFIIANVITGSRLAVVTNVMVILIAAGLLFIRGKTKNIGRLVGFIICIAISVVVAKIIVPEAFEAYEARTGDRGIVDEEELTQRAEHAIMGWWWIYQKQDPGLFGFGLGSMSNGVQNFSGYAARIRDRVWGETDLANVVLEGGLYLVILWMSVRIFIILQCLKLYMQITSPRLMFIASFALGYIIFNGLTQTLGSQPPLAIWWWISIGLLMHVFRFEQFLKHQKKTKFEQSKLKTKPIRPPKPPSKGKLKSLPNLKPKPSL